MKIQNTDFALAVIIIETENTRMTFTQQGLDIMQCILHVYLFFLNVCNVMPDDCSLN